MNCPGNHRKVTFFVGDFEIKHHVMRNAIIGDTASQTGGMEIYLILVHHTVITNEMSCHIAAFRMLWNAVAQSGSASTKNI